MQKRGLILLYFFSYIGFSFVMTQFTPFLAKLGYIEWQRGILLSSYAITTIIFQLLFGALSDRFHTIKRFVLISLFMFAIVMPLFFLQTEKMFYIHIMMVALGGGLVNTCCGLYDTWTLSSGDELHNQLSFIKTFGSIGWGLGSIILTFVIDWFGYSGISIAILIVSSIAFFLSSRITDVQKKKVSVQKVTKKDYKDLLSNKPYILLVFALFLMYCGIICNNITVVDKMIFLKATAKQIGYKWSIQSFIEIPTYLSGAYFLRKYNHFLLLKISAIAIALQFCLYGLSNNVPLIISLSAMQMLTTPLLLITSKTLIFELSANNMKTTGQLFALSMFTGVSALLVPTLAGIISSTFNVTTTLFGISCLALVAFILIIKIEKLVKIEMN